MADESKQKMKSKGILFLCIILAILGLAVFGYFKAVSSEGNAKIEISPKSFDFGEIEYGQIVEHAFKVKNSGNDVLEIKRVATSCACTTGKVEKDKLDSGEETDLLVIYDSGAMSGPHGKGEQERIIYIKSNDPINPQVEVTIHAYVK